MSDLARREARVRLLARRQGFVAKKSRRRNSECTDYGLWMLVDAENVPTVWPWRTLEDLEHVLNETPEST